MLNQLQEQFGTAQILFVEGAGGLTKIAISTSAAEAEIYLHGAHVTHFQPRGHKPVLYLSPSSAFRIDKPIRGGVPICWPWFGPRADDPNAPMHGFARVSKWAVESTANIDDANASITLALSSTEYSKSLWPHDFSLRYSITVGPVLQLALETTNRQKSGFLIGEALHSYFSVGDAVRIAVRGLTGTTYFDKVTASRRLEERDPIRMQGETDNVYLNTRAAVVIDDPTLSRRIRIEKNGSNSTVLWNPWEQKSASMADLGAGMWKGFVCVETVNTAENSVSVAPGASHTVRASISVGE